jgi:hypothetical protein
MPKTTVVQFFVVGSVDGSLNRLSAEDGRPLNAKCILVLCVILYDKQGLFYRADYLVSLCNGYTVHSV